MPACTRIAVLFAVPQEMTPLARLLPPAAEGPPALKLPAALRASGDRQVLLVTGGMGGRRAAEAAAAIIRAWRPELLVMAGVAGALAEDLAVGDVIAADAVYTSDEALAPSLVPAGVLHPHRTGPLLSLDRVLVTADEKRAAHQSIARRPRPLAVEMETAAVARVAGEHGVPWAAVRAVSDTAGESLPLDFNRLRTPDGDLPVSRVAVAAITHPRSIPGLIRLGGNTAAASKSLAAFLVEWLTRI